MTDQHHGRGLSRAQVDRLLISSRTVRDVIISMTGSDSLEVRLLRTYGVRRINAPGLSRLDTAGPVLGRELELAEPMPPRRVLAFCIELIVPARLPEGLVVTTSENTDSLDRLLDAAGIEWHSELMAEPDAAADPNPRHPADQAALALRRMWIDQPSLAPCALVFEELRLASLI